MAKRQFPQENRDAMTPPPELQQILCDLESPDACTRANAVRALCPCRGAQWGLPIFTRVLAMRNDPSPLVRRAVQHDLQENPDWGERQELRRLEGLRWRGELRQVRDEIDAGPGEGPVPGPHSLAWRMRRRPRGRKRR